LRRSRSIAVFGAIFLFMVICASGCGNGYNSGVGIPGTVTGGTSGGATGLQERAFVADQVPSSANGVLQVVDANKDQPAISSSSFSPFIVNLGGTLPQLMVPGPNSTTLVFNAGDNGISTVDNTKETLATKIGSIDCTATGAVCEIALPGAAESMAVSSDGKFVYAAIRTANQVSVADLTGSAITVKNIPATPGNCQATNNCLPNAQRIVLSHNNAKLLVFSQDIDQFEVINTSDNSVKTLSGTGLDRPTYGVFSADDSKAYILNCGPECGGAQASVSVVDMTSFTVTQSVNVDAATIGASDSTNLYVAGSNPASSQAGSVTILPLSSLTPGKPIAIGNGFHQVISLFQSKIIIGARTCTTGCLSIVDPTAGTAIVDSPAAGQLQKGDVTAITNVTPRNVVYTAEGGEVRVYDVTTGQEKLSNNTPVIDVVGKVTGVLYVGPKT
jgi:hypothetical protein